MSFEETIVRTSVKHRRSFTLRTKRQLKAYSCRPWLQVAVLIFLQPSAVRATLPCVAQSFILSPATTFATLKRVTHDSALYVRWLKDGRLERGSDKVVGLRGNCFESYKEKRDYRWRLVRFTADRTCPRVHDENVYTSERKFPVRGLRFSFFHVFNIFCSKRPIVVAKMSLFLSKRPLAIALSSVACRLVKYLLFLFPLEDLFLQFIVYT